MLLNRFNKAFKNHVNRHRMNRLSFIIIFFWSIFLSENKIWSFRQLFSYHHSKTRYLFSELCVQCCRRFPPNQLIDFFSNINALDGIACIIMRTFDSSVCIKLPHQRSKSLGNAFLLFHY